MALVYSTAIGNVHTNVLYLNITKGPLHEQYLVKLSLNYKECLFST